MEHLLGEEQQPKKKVKLQTKKKPNDIFKKIKNSKIEKCKRCFLSRSPKMNRDIMQDALKLALRIAQEIQTTVWGYETTLFRETGRKRR